MTKELRRAFVFPGQGSQLIGMGKNLVNHTDIQLAQIAKKTYEEASDALGYDVLSLCLTGPKELLNTTRMTQPALFTTSIAALRLLLQQEITPDIVAGHSLGEYSANVAAGTLGFAQALMVVARRGEFMEAAGIQNPGRMAAILGLPFEEVSRICESSGAQIANYNLKTQIIIAGGNNIVANAVKLAEGRQGRAKYLDVSIAGHCKLMEPAKQRLQTLLEGERIGDPKLPIIVNATGDYARNGNEVRQFLIDQMTQSVLWLDTVRRMIGDGVTTCIEVGPGNVLTNLMRRIKTSPSITNTDAIFPAARNGREEGNELIHHSPPPTANA